MQKICQPSDWQIFWIKVNFLLIPVTFGTPQYLRVGKILLASSGKKVLSIEGTHFGTGLPLTTSRASLKNCGPSKGLHSTVAFNLPAIIASNAPRAASTETIFMSL